MEEFLEAIAALVTLVTIAIGVRRMAQDVRKLPDLPARARLGLRIARIGTVAVGGTVILVSLYFGLKKAIYIYQTPSTQGVITGVQRSSRASVAPYSFYVDFKAAGRRRREFAYTSLLFPKKEGDPVTLLYDPTDPRKTEIVGFDSEWIGYLILFAAGLLIICFSGSAYGWRDPRKPSGNSPARR